MNEQLVKVLASQSKLPFPNYTKMSSRVAPLPNAFYAQ